MCKFPAQRNYAVTQMPATGFEPETVRLRIQRTINCATTPHLNRAQNKRICVPTGRYISSPDVRNLPICLLRGPVRKLALSSKSFSVSNPAVWNSLPMNCLGCNNFTTFKRLLKCEMFSSAYNTITRRTGRSAPLIRLRPCKCVHYIT